LDQANAWSPQTFTMTTPKKNEETNLIDYNVKITPLQMKVLQMACLRYQKPIEKIIEKAIESIADGFIHSAPSSTTKELKKAK
jgi:hypothetical protein